MHLLRIVSLLALCAIPGASSLAQTTADAPLRVTVESLPPGGGLSECPYDSIRMRIFAGVQHLLSRDRCSAYAAGTAQLVTDRTNRSFVLLEYAEGKGTHATTRYLQVYELKRAELFDRGRVLRSTPAGSFADLEYDYAVVTPPQGGIKLTGVPTVVGQLRQGEASLPQGDIILSVE